MDKRKSYFIGLDTETCNSYTTADGKLELKDSLVYDIGWAVCDKKGNILVERSYIVREIFFGMREQMKTAYYAKKLPRYYDDIANGSRVVASLWEIRKQLRADYQEWNIKAIFAHNANFDYRALNNTVRYCSGSACRYFYPYGAELWDTLKMSKVITQQKSYRKFCEINNYMTNHNTPRPRATAEILYRYISGNTDFIESHTGLEDVKIETKIFAHCIRQHKKMNKLLFRE